MKLTLTNTFVFAHDPDLALAFYRDVLGLEARADFPAGEFRWITLSPPTQPEIEIVLTHPQAGRSAAEGDLMLELLTKGSLAAVNFTTEDLDSSFEKIRASGAEVLQEPTDQGWGKRDCAVRDPSGNTVRISQA